jgi:hypothetical protein
MNIYARYFDQEVVASSFEELLTFLTSIPEITVTTELLDSVKAYIDSPIPYPKRYKLRPRVYFILIKTTAKNIQEFKNNRNKADNAEKPSAPPTHQAQKEDRAAKLNESKAGWYKVSLSIKRMVHIKELQKFQYQDNSIVAYINEASPIACYNRLLEYFKTRDDIDPRSQIPSARSESFKFEYIGANVNFIEANPDSTADATNTTEC